MIDFPMVYKISDDIKSLQSLKNQMPTENERNAAFEFPVVYIHTWKKDKEYEVYVGEANDIIQRTMNHYADIKKANDWHINIGIKSQNPELYVISHNHFNKSLTMDIENQLIHYMSSIPNVRTANGRGNPQNQYFPDEEFSPIFKNVWNKLRNLNKDLFAAEEDIVNNAFFKASPLHKLSSEQIEAKTNILEVIRKILSKKNDSHAVIFVEGEAGSGKTVLNSSIFYELCTIQNEEEPLSLGLNKLKCSFLINHDEQVKVFQQIVNRLGLVAAEGQELVSKPTRFINRNNPENNLIFKALEK